MEFEVVATLPPSIRPLEGMDCSDGLLSIEGHTVRWHSPYGRSIIREFTCDHPPLRAMFCSFPLAGESFQSSVVIVLARHKIRIIASGARYDINLNFSIRNVFSSSIGLIIERSAENAGVVVHPAEGVPLLYTITHPIMRVGYLSLPSAAWADGGADGCPVVLSARGPFLCVLDASATRVLVLKIASTQHLSRCDHNDSILNHDQPLCSPFSADVSRGSSGSRVKHAESSFDVNTGPCGHGQCDLEIRGRGFPSSARSDSFPPPPELKRIGSFNDNETNSQSLMANFASAAGENSNSAAVGGSRLRYAGGAVGRRRRFDKSKSNHRGHSDSSYGEMRVDTFYNALLGIDPSWSLQQNAAVTATWLRQASADMPSLHSGDPVDLEVDLSVNISSATPASLRGAAFETSGLSSSFLSRSDAEILSSGSSIFFSDNLTIIHVCSVLLAEKQFLSSAIEMDFKGIHLYTSRNTGTFFDRISRSGSSGSESWILSPHSVGVTASVTQIISGENVIDIIFEKSGEFFRYALPGLIQNQCHSESGAFSLFCMVM